ncbi:hypothetical protein [Promicromonospora sp. NFX87]|uniref:hypothetical protein n=1 Tax=Promicromonospora sp. NFX87 TaxID=3402691 RepID=UPI003AFB2AF5
MDPTWNPEFEPGLAELADLAALTDRETSDATAPHALIAKELWTSLRRLGVSGRMLVMGEDAEVYAGLPRTERLISPGATAELIGLVPGSSWPHTGLQLHQHPGTQPDPFDLVITNMPANDLVTRSAVGSARQWQQHAINALGSIGLTSPGGLSVLLASSRLLDDTDPYVRREMSRAVELLGALRLPAGTLRRAPGNDGTVDLILLHHRGSPGTTPFTESTPVTLDGRDVHVNQYYDAHPDHVLGTLTSRDNPWGPADTTVVPGRVGLATELRAGLNAIVRSARARGLKLPADAADLDVSIDSMRESGGRAPTRPSAIRAQDLGEARAVVARLRAQRRNADPITPDHPAPSTSPGPEPPGL